MEQLNCLAEISFFPKIHLDTGSSPNGAKSTKMIFEDNRTGLNH